MMESKPFCNIGDHPRLRNAVALLAAALPSSVGADAQFGHDAIGDQENPRAE